MIRKPFLSTDYSTFWNKIFFSFQQVIVPSGIKVVLERNTWGIDVTIYAPRTKKPENEEGLCMYKGSCRGELPDSFGNKQRWEFVLTSYGY